MATNFGFTQPVRGNRTEPCTVLLRYDRPSIRPSVPVYDRFGIRFARVRPRLASVSQHTSVRSRNTDSTELRTRPKEARELLACCSASQCSLFGFVHLTTHVTQHTTIVKQQFNPVELYTTERSLARVPGHGEERMRSSSFASIIREGKICSDCEGCV